MVCINIHWEKECPHRFCPSSRTSLVMNSCGMLVIMGFLILGTKQRLSQPGGWSNQPPQAWGGFRLHLSRSCHAAGVVVCIDFLQAGSQALFLLPASRFLSFLCGPYLGQGIRSLRRRPGVSPTPHLHPTPVFLSEPVRQLPGSCLRAHLLFLGSFAIIPLVHTFCLLRDQHKALWKII